MHVVKIWLVSLLLVVGAATCYYFSSVFALFFIAMAAAYILNPAVQFFQNKTRNVLYRDRQTRKAYRGFSVFIVLLIVFVVLSICFGSLRTMVTSQLTGLIAELPQMEANFQVMLKGLEQTLVQMSLPYSIIQPLQDFIAQIDVYIGRLSVQILAALAGLTTRIFDIILFVIMLVYFMLDGEKIVERLHQFFQRHSLNRISQLLQDVNIMLWVYIKSRVLISAGMATTVYLGLTIGGIRYAGLFAVMSFMLDFIPYFGSLIGGIVITLFSLIAYDPGTAVKVGIFILVVQQLEGNVIVPKVQGDQIKVHPLLILMALMLCNALWGPLAMLIAVPLAGVMKNIFMLIVEFLVSPSGDIREFLKGTDETEAADAAAKGPVAETESGVSAPTEVAAKENEYEFLSDREE